MAPHFQLRIKTLKFISAVDRGAQGPIANAALIKRAPSGDNVEAMCKVACLDEKLGLVFGWACVSTTTGGAPHIDLQKDAIIGGDELIKVAAAFVEAGANSDVMHDCEPDGKIVFAMPLTADVKTALQLQSDVEGLAIAMKPSPETFKRFVAKELNAFSIYGEGERILVGKSEPEPIKPVAAPVDKAGKKKRGKGKAPLMDGMAPAYKRIGKRAVFTSEVDGHVHQIDLDDPACCWSTTLCTTYQNAAGSEYGHSHPWLYDVTTGAITIGADSGHTHTVSDVVPADVLAAAAAKDDDEPEPACAPVCADDKPGGPTVVVAVAQRAPDAPAAVPPVGDSTQAGAAPTVVNKEQEMPTEQEIQIAKQATDITNLRKMLAASLALTEPMRLHVGKLAPTSVDEFLMLDGAGRDAAIAAALAADPEVHKTASGFIIRKSDGPVALELAKQADASAAVLKAQTEEIAKARGLTEQVTLEKRASTELSHFAKGVAVSAAILKALDGIADETVRKDALEAVKGANFALAKLGKPLGAPDGGEPQVSDPNVKLNELAKAHQAANKTTFAKAYDAVLQTEEGSALYNEIEKISKASHPAMRAV